MSPPMRLGGGGKEREDEVEAHDQLLLAPLTTRAIQHPIEYERDVPDSVLARLFLFGFPPVDLFLVNEDAPSSSSPPSSSSFLSGARFSLLLKKSSPSPPRLDRVFLIGEGEPMDAEGPAFDAAEEVDTERGRLNDAEDEGGVRAETGRERDEEARVIRVWVEDILSKE